MLNRINKLHPTLSAAEQRVADYVRINAQDVISSTLAEIAMATGVSEPTVVRFCRSCGATGFRDFKLSLTQHLATNDRIVHTDVSPADDAPKIINKVIGRSIKELIDVQQRLNPESVEKIAAQLAKADQIVFFGIGASGLVVSDVANKFFRLGIPCTVYTDSPTILQAAAITNPRTVVLLVSKSGASNIIIQAAQLAKKNHATVIAVTTPGSPLAEAADLSLLIDVDEDTGTYTPMSSRLAQLAVLDVLQVALALQLGDEGYANLERSKKALQ